MVVVITTGLTPAHSAVTSSASPIISGAALILQGLYKANTAKRLSPPSRCVSFVEPADRHGSRQGRGWEHQRDAGLTSDH